MATNTWTGATNTAWNNAGNWTEANYPGDTGHLDDDVVIPDTTSLSNAPTLHGHITCDSLSILANATITGGGYRITVSDKSSASGSGTYSVFNAGTISGNLDLTINTSSNNLVRFAGSSGNCFKEVRLNNSPVFEYVQNSYVEQLVIAAGTLQPYSSSYSFTAQDSASITGTFNCLAASPISLGSGIDDAYSVVVNASGTFLGGTGATHTLGAVSVNSSANGFTFTTGTTTINGRATSGNSRRVFSTSSTSAVTMTSGNLIINQARTPLSIRCDDTSGIKNLRMECGAGNVLHIDNPLTITNELYVKTGEVTTRNVGDTTNNALTVTKNMIVGPDSGDNQGKFTAGSVGCTIGSGRTDIAALHVREGGEADLGTGDHTIGSLVVDNNSTARFSNTEGTLTINGHSNDGTRSIIVGGGSTCTAPSSGTRVTDLTYGSDALLTISNTAAIYNLTITGNATYRLKNHMFIDNDLRVTASSSLKCQTSATSGTHRNFTLGGDLRIFGVVDCEDAATITVGGGIQMESGTFDATSNSTIVSGVLSTGYVGMSIYGGTTFNHNNGTFQFNNSGETWIASNTTGHDITFKNLTINGNQYMNKADIIVDNYLLINAGKSLRQYNSYNQLTVNGLCLVNGTLGSNGKTGDFQFGTLEVASGATFNAPDANTTITTGGTVAGTGSMAFGGEGTFNANNGTLILDSTQHRMPAGGTFNNLTLNGEQNADGIYAYTTTMLPQPTMPDGNTGAAMIHIKGTLQINHDEFRPYNTDRIWIHNLVIGDGTGSANSAKFDMSEADSFDGTVYVDNVTINSDGQFLFGDGDETSSTAGSSALNIYGSFRNLGGSVDIS
jgi:hypothetical protein